LRKKFEELLRKAEAVDEDEDRKYGKDKKGLDLPEELQRRETRLKKIKEAMKALRSKLPKRQAGSHKDRQEENTEEKREEGKAAETKVPVAVPADKDPEKLHRSRFPDHEGEQHQVL